VAPPRAGRAAPFLVPWAPAPLQPPAGRDAPAPDPGALDDLAIVFNSRLESKLQRVRNDRCTTAQRSVLGNSCVGVFQPAFDFQFNVRTGGVVADRVAVNVDYDSQREFDASNNIAVRYQGKPGERLQSVEVGNVTFQPPASRFLSAGIPSGNYGVQATGRVGAMRVTGIVAQQKGHVSRDNVFTVGERTRQQVERVIEDIQVESRRFFFTIDPRQLPGYPNIDLLNRPQLQRLAAGLPDSLRPVRLYVYRQLVGATIQNPRGPQLSVRGARNPARQVYEVLRENVDYYVDPSLLWIALVRPLNQNTERLAVAYEVRVNGQPGRNVATGGTPDIEGTEAPQVANLLWEPELQPANAEYFLREIKSVYRLGGEDLQRGSLALKVVTGTSGDQEKPADPSRGETYLQLFGLAQPTNPAAFDVENRVWPRPNDPNVSLAFGADGAQQPLIRDLFVFFPSLQPFARAGLAQPAANPANDTLYRYPNEYLYSAQRPQALYRLLASYQSEGGGPAHSIRLGAIQLRPNSERVALDGRPLVRDRDYTIDYDLGTISFTRPDTLFPQPRQVSVRYEENPLFAVVPTTILGFSSQVPLDRGQVALTAIAQQQRSGLTRPPLGFEPQASFVAGVTGAFAWEATALDRALGAIPGRASGPARPPSRLALEGELALSKPQPNSAGQAYLESFEGEAGVGIPLTEASWGFGSRPAAGGTLAGRLGAGTLALNRAATLAYQNNGVDAAGNYVQFSIQQIDPAVRTVGGGVQPPESLLWLSLYPLRTGGIHDVEPGTGRRRYAWTVGDQSQVGPTPAGRRWRSLRTILNPSGADLSRIETLEFFVLVQAEAAKRPRNPVLVLDFGEVSENSVAFAPETLTVRAPPRPGLPPDSTYRGKRLVGYDRLDTERNRLSRAFNAVEDDTGLPGDVADTLVVVDQVAGGGVPVTRVGVPLCTQAVQVAQRLGDSRANCGARNNRLDEEDIDLDGQLNLPAAATDREAFRRFVVDLADTRSWTRTGRCFQQRDSTAAGVTADSLCWVQVRLNWRAPAEEVNAPNDRRMRALRLTMVSGAQAADDAFTRVALARLRLVGAPWLKRAATPLSGIAGDSSAAPGGYVVASVVGTLDSSGVLPYAPPPGVVEAPENRQSGYEGTRIQVNERALRLQAGIPGRAFRPFDRAEAFFRFPEGTKTFMGYRTLRLWMRGRGNGWGPTGELNGFVKIGRDEHNFYLYRTPVQAGPGAAAWEPEVRVDLTRFQQLRAQLENAVLRGGADSLQCTGIDLELVRRSGAPRGVTARRHAVCQDGYIVYSADPAVTPPNLAGVQELAVGFVRVDSLPRGGTGILDNDTLELWVNDLRLGDVVDDIGVAGELGLTLTAGDVADVRVTLSRRDPNFRQLGEVPTFLSTGGVAVGTVLHAEKFLPARLGIVLPVSVDYASSAVDPLFITRTDIRAGGIAGLRAPRDRRLTTTLALRRAVPLERGWYAPLVNGLALNGSWTSGGTQSAFQEARNGSYLLGASLAMGSDRREGTLPRVLARALDALPAPLRGLGAVRAVREGRYQWTPTQFRLASALSRADAAVTSFTRAAAAPDDTGQRVTALTHVWQNSGTLEFRPTPALSASVSARQLFDLRDYRTGAHLPDSTDRGVAAAAERRRLLGADVGLERERSVTSTVLFQPAATGWLAPRLDFSSTYGVVADPNARVLLRANDTTGAFRLPRRLGASQNLSAGTVVTLSRLLAPGATGARARLARLLGPVDLSWQQGLTSNYDNTSYRPGWDYQFGLGSVDDFRGTTTRLATTAGRQRRGAVLGSLNLPLSLTVQSRLERGTTETWTRRVLDGFQAVITSTQQVDPDLTVRWSWRPVRLRRLVTLVNVNGRYVMSEQETVVPNETGGLADRGRTVARSRPISGSVSWALFGGLTTNGSMDRTRREDIRPGAVTTGDTRRLSLDLSRRFTLPTRWNPRTPPLRVALSYQSEETRSVVQGVAPSGGEPGGSAAGTDASVLTSNGRRAFNLNGDTDLSELLTFSVTASQVVNFDRNYNRQTTNLIFSAVLQLRFFAGELR
jgi:cell surface protein SprA